MYWVAVLLFLFAIQGGTIWRVPVGSKVSFQKEASHRMPAACSAYTCVRVH